MDDGSLMCWGSNDDGKLGMLKLPNTYATSPVGPVNLGSGRTAKAVSLGSESHTCAILDDDTLKCWGDGGYGRLGYGDYTQREDPEATAVVNLGSGHTAKAVSAGRQHTCAILDDDTLKCWGRGSNGRLGYGDTTDRNAPEATAVVNLGAGRTAKALSLGDSHTCAILDDDTLKCWGANNNGQLGDTSTTTRTSPVAVDVGSGRAAKALSLGYDHTCAILDDDTLKCWGYNNYGQLGYGDTDDRGDATGEMGDALLAINLGTGRTAKAVSAGYYHTCAILDDDTLKCWGNGGLTTTISRWYRRADRTTARCNRPDFLEFSYKIPKILIARIMTAGFPYFLVSLDYWIIINLTTL